MASHKRLPHHPKIELFLQRVGEDFLVDNIRERVLLLLGKHSILYSLEDLLQTYSLLSTHPDILFLCDM